MGDAAAHAWRKAFTSLLLRLLIELPDEALAPLRDAFDVRGSIDLTDFFTVAQKRSIFTGAHPEMAAKKLVDTLNACCPRVPSVVGLNRVFLECFPTASRAAREERSPSVPTPPAAARLPPKFERLAEVLIYYGFGGLVSRFVEAEVDLETAVELSSEQLVRLGVPPLEVRRLQDGLIQSSEIHTAKVRPYVSLCAQCGIFDVMRMFLCQ